MTTSEILVEVQDLGRRLAGINVDLPATEAMTELAACAEILHDLQRDLALQSYQERYDGNGLPY